MKSQTEKINLAAITYKDLLDLVYRTGSVRFIQAYTELEDM